MKEKYFPHPQKFCPSFFLVNLAQEKNERNRVGMENNSKYISDFFSWFNRKTSDKFSSNMMKEEGGKPMFRISSNSYHY